MTTDLKIVSTMLSGEKKHIRKQMLNIRTYNYLNNTIKHDFEEFLVNDEQYDIS